MLQPALAALPLCEVLGGQGLCRATHWESQSVPGATTSRKEIPAWCWFCAKSFPVQGCSEEERVGLVLSAAEAAQEFQVGRNRLQCGAAGRDLSILVLLLCSQESLWCFSPSGLQESLWCFFCSWYSIIFCWKYAVEEKSS